MLVCWGATAEKTQDFRAGIPELVLFTRQDGDRVAGFYFGVFAFDANSAFAGGDKINLLGPPVVMLHGASANGHARFGEALVADCGIPMRQKLANFRAVFGREPWEIVQVFDVHRLEKSSPEPRRSPKAFTPEPRWGLLRPQLAWTARPWLFRFCASGSACGVFV